MTAVLGTVPFVQRLDVAPGMAERPSPLNNRAPLLFSKEDRMSANSSDYTPEKNQIFESLLRANMAVVAAAKQKHRIRTPYLYGDLTGGEGMVGPDRRWEGSPVIASRLLSTTFHKSFVFERDKLAAIELARNLSHDRDAKVFAEDFEMIRILVEPILRSSFILGMIYWDGNGTIPPKEKISEIFSMSQKFFRVDLLMHIASTPMKRARGASKAGTPGHKDKNHPRLMDILKSIGKKKWLVSTPKYNHQWVFVLGTNYENYSEYARIGMRDIKTFDGMRNLMVGTHTVDELALAREEVERRSGRVCEDRAVCGEDLIPIESPDGEMGWSDRNDLAGLGGFYWSCKRCQNGRKARRNRPA